MGWGVHMSSEKNDQYPRADLPTIYAEGIGSCSWHGGMVRMYLSEEVQSLLANGEDTVRPVAKLVMPRDAFLFSVKFFNKIVRKMQEQDMISEDDLKEILFGETETAPTADDNGK